MVRHLVTSATDPVFGDILFCWGVKKEDTSPTEDSIYLDFSMLHFLIPLFLYDTCLLYWNIVAFLQTRFSVSV